MAKAPKSSDKSAVLKTASVLAFERKLEPSDAVMSAGAWDDRASPRWPAIQVIEKSVRGTISNRLSTKDADPAKLDASIQSPNLQRVDVATLPSDRDTLRVQFTLRVLRGAGAPSACNDSGYREKLESVVTSYRESLGFDELAVRYATNLAAGRFLWRNRIGAEACEVTIQLTRDGRATRSWTFDADTLSRGSFPSRGSSVLEVAAEIAAGLSGARPVLLTVIGHVRLGAAQEVFPSQELILDKKDSGKSKTLYQVSGAAAIHSQKVGNALRTIDTWYLPDAERPIAVEPYGSVTSEGHAYRPPREKLDFYTLLDDWVLRDKAPQPEQQHYVIANLVRGGVFGEKAE
jgi:CRISPR-associated protein Csy3